MRPRHDATPAFVRWFSRPVCLWRGFVAAIAASVLMTGPLHARDIPLVVAGRSDAAIVIPADTPVQTRQAVEELADYVRRISDAPLPIEQVSVPGRVELHIGPTDFVSSLKLSLEDLGIDGFRILFPGEDRIVLIGFTPTGTEFAVREFIERYLGVRWLFPGELGTHVPRAAEITIPAEAIVSCPAYTSRTISNPRGGQTGGPVWLFLQRHRRHWTVEHHHSLNKLISPDELYEQHPEFFPLIEGRREKPEPEGYYWQPMLGAPGIVDVSIERITRFFSENPGKSSYSLGINDNNHFLGITSRGMNSLGIEDYSDDYFGYANAVVEGVLQTHPDKWFGCLAYLGITDPPRQTPVHPRIVPHICIDRAGWADESIAQRDMQRTRNWHVAAPTLGWYDYIYGDEMYRLPRLYNHLMQRYLQFGAANGVRALYAEYYGDHDAWIDGPKLYVFMKLLWDPAADVDALTQEWCRLAVGERAAQALTQYYAFWEDYWTNRVPRTDWFRQYADRVYMNFTATGYLDALTDDDLATCRGLIEQVVTLAQTPQEQARAAFIAQGFAGIVRDTAYVARTRSLTAPAAGQTLFDESFTPASDTMDDALPPSWGGWQHQPGTARFHVSREGRTDAHSAAIVAGNAGTSGIFRDVLLQSPGQMYQLTASVRCERVNPKAYVGIQITWTRPDRSYLTRPDGSVLPHKYGGNHFESAERFEPGVWKPMSFFVRAPPVDGPVNMQIGLLAMDGKTGIVRFDDVRLVQVDPKTLAAIEAGDPMRDPSPQAP